MQKRYVEEQKMRSLGHACIEAVVALSCVLGVVQGAENEQLLLGDVQSKGDKRRQVDLTVVGNVRIADGIGKQAIDLIEILRDLTNISFIHTSSIQKAEIKSLSKPLQKILCRSGAAHPGRILIYEDLLSYPPKDTPSDRAFWRRFKTDERTKKQIRFAYTMFESSAAPKGWVSIINRSFDAVIVPDEFLVQVYRDSGVTKPIFVIPLGRDFSAFLEVPLKKGCGNPLVFANYSSCIPRKNLLTLVRAFGDAFGNSQEVRLHLCWRDHNPEYRGEIFKEIHERGLSNITIEESPVDSRTYLQRFLEADCYVNIATGEGFSIQPREAMALGIPVIVTDNTGQKTICSSGLVRVVPSKIEIPAMYTFPGDFGLQYQCTTEDVSIALRDVYERYDEYLQKGQKAREWAGQYQCQRMAPMYMSLIRPQKVILGNEDKILEDGIMTTSKKLVRKYKKIMKIQ